MSVKITKNYSGAFSGLLCLLLVGCASSGTTVPAASCRAPDTSMEDYKIGPGDNLEVVVWRNSELSVTVPVRPDGKISTPLVDDVMASGREPSELAAEIERVLSEYLRSPKVSIIVTSQGAANQIQVVGEVAVPQSLSYREGLRVLDLVVAVGGMTEFAAGNRANIVRMIGDEQIECRVKLKSLVSGDMSQNIPVFPGDVLVVPQTRF